MLLTARVEVTGLGRAGDNLLVRFNEAVPWTQTHRCYLGETGSRFGHINRLQFRRRLKSLRLGSFSVERRTASA